MSQRVSAFRKRGVETCEYIGPEGVFWSRGAHILRSDTLDGPLTSVARIPRPFARRMLGQLRLGRRLARETVYVLLPLSDGSLFFSFGQDVGFIRDGKVELIQGRARRHRILRGGAARLPDGSIVFGEYFDNADREAVRLYRVVPGVAQAQEVYQFAAGEVRHIHSVTWDALTGRAVVSAGDIDDECRIVAFTPDFQTAEVLGIGTEDWRTISPQFSKDAIYYGTDAQYAQNRLFRYDRTTQNLTPLADVNGPVFYSVSVADGWVFGTSAELCPSQTSPEAILYHIADQTNDVTILARFPKDRWSKYYFQFGILNFPEISGETSVIPVSGTALKGLDGQFVQLKSE